MGYSEDKESKRDSRETTVGVWALQIIQQPKVEGLTIPSLEENKKYAELVLEVLLLGIILSLAESSKRLPNGFLPSIFCDSSTLAYGSTWLSHCRMQISH